MSLNARDLDRHITGNYGQDAYKHSCPECGHTCHCDGCEDASEECPRSCSHCKHDCEKLIQHRNAEAQR